jgi:hypothetical protein
MNGSKEFVELKKRRCLNLPIEDESIDIAAQTVLLIFLKQKI